MFSPFLQPRLVRVVLPGSSVWVAAMRLELVAFEVSVVLRVLSALVGSGLVSACGSGGFGFVDWGDLEASRGGSAWVFAGEGGVGG